jgi:hypothetical protein
MAKKTHEKMLTSLSHKGNAKKDQLRFYLTLLEWLSSRIPPTTGVGEDAGKRNPHTLLVGM